MDKTLINIISKMVAEERYRKKPKFKGTVKEKRFSKKGNILLLVERPKSEMRVCVNQNKKSLFETADKIKVKDKVYVEGEQGIDIVWCDRLQVLCRETPKEQTKLE